MEQLGLRSSRLYRRRWPQAPAMRGREQDDDSADDLADEPELYEDEDRDSYEADIFRQEDMYGDLYTDIDEEEDAFDEEELYEDLGETSDDEEGAGQDGLEERTDFADDPLPMRENYRDKG